MARCVIFAALPPGRQALEYIQEGTLVLAADAGWRHALELGVVPHLVLGDFDSSTPPEGVEILRLPQEKDDTDTQAAVRLALERGMDDIVVLGGFGGRVDHMYANLQSMAFAASHGARAVLAGDGVEARIFAAGVHRLARKQNCYLSVFSFAGEATGVCLSGVAYPLHNAVLRPTFPVGASNEFVADEARLSFDKGLLLVIVQPKDAADSGDVNETGV